MFHIKATTEGSQEALSHLQFENRRRYYRQKCSMFIPATQLELYLNLARMCPIDALRHAKFEGAGYIKLEAILGKVDVGVLVPMAGI